MVEEIILESHFGNDSNLRLPDEDNRIINAECRSALCRKKRIVSYRLLNKMFIEALLTQGKKQETSSSIFHIGFLSPETKKKYELNWIWLYSSLVCALIGTLLYFLSSPAYTTIAVLVACTYLALFVKSFNIIFYIESKSAKAPLLLFSKKNDSNDKMKTFLNLLNTNIREHPLPSGLNVLAEEMKVLRELSEANIIHDVEYQNYRNYLLAQFNKVKI